MIDDNYQFGRKDLEEVLGRSRWTIMRWEKEGRLTLPRNSFGWRVLTSQQIKEVKDAFSPGGKGKWHFVSSSKELN
jgi:hypothetical protein